MKDFAVRKIDPAYIQRARGIDGQNIPDHLDSIAVSLHQALDAWRFHNGSGEDVSLCIDALVALWSVVESRQHV